MFRPNTATDNSAQDACVLKRTVTFDDEATKKCAGCIGPYKRGCFVLKTKQGTNTAAPVTAA